MGESAEVFGDLDSAAVPVLEDEAIGGDALSVADAWVTLAEEAGVLESRLASVRAKMRAREDWLLEQMAAGKLDRLTIRGKTLYPIRDVIVSRAKGVELESLLVALEMAGLGDIIGETVAPNTLKATIKEIRNLAIDQGRRGDAMKCPRCGRLYEATERSCGSCVSEAGLVETVPVVDGVPRELWDRLYIEDRLKLGCRSS